MFLKIYIASVSYTHLFVFSVKPIDSNSAINVPNVSSQDEFSSGLFSIFSPIIKADFALFASVTITSVALLPVSYTHLGILNNFREFPI